MLVADTLPEPIHRSDAREQVLRAAEQHFALKGYAGTTLRDIGTAVGIRHASLYHHAPGGKEELFIAVTERSLHRHRAGLEAALGSATGGIRTRLYAAADWLLSQAPMDLVRMAHADMPAIDPQQAQRLSTLAMESLIRPVERVLVQAAACGEIEHHDLGVIAGGLVGMIESLHSIPEISLIHEGRTRVQVAHVLIDAILDGLHAHKEENRNASSALFQE